MPMRKVELFAALALSGLTVSCAERAITPATTSTPVPPEAAHKARPRNVEARRRAEKDIDDAFHQAMLHPSPKTEHPPGPEAPPPQASQPPQETPTQPVVVALPPPPEPAEPTFPAGPPNIELPPPPEPATPTLAEVPVDAMMPAPPEPAEPSFPAAALIPPLAEPVEPSPRLPEIAAESPISIPFPEPPSYLALRPRFDWADVVGSIEVPYRPPSEALALRPERHIPSLIQNPWPLPVDDGFDPPH